MERIVSKEQLAQATRLKSKNPLVGILYRISGIEKVNSFYDRMHHLEDLDFIKKCFELLDLTVEVSEEDLKKIPAEGAFMTVSNHPFGAIDGLALIQTVASQRDDYKVLVNFLLQNIEQISPRMIGVNPFDGTISQASSFRGTKEALTYLSEGHPIGVFPAGEVSTFQRDVRTITDGPWSTSVIKLVQRSGVPVVPIYFDGKNSRLFHLLGVIHPSLRTLRLPAEFANKKGKTLRMRIGKPISAESIAEFEDIGALSRYLRAKTYALGTSIEVKREYFSALRFPKRQKDLIPAVEKEVIASEIEKLEDKKLFEQQNFSCYCVKAREIPNILREIGRLREITFRAVGEGTNKSLDLDEYDLYYEHLILYDHEAKQIAGAYRIGKGFEIMRRYGHRGFYTTSLFRMDEEMYPILERSIELGRSFITQEYQRQRLPLFLLWKGILLALIKQPELRYILGPVTISGSYQEVSKGLIMEFIKRYYFDEELAQHVHPRKPYMIKSKQVDREALLNATENDMKKLDKLLAEIEPTSFTMPVLLKKYLHQNARILGFNLDPKFNNALDGLMLLDLKNLPEETVENLQKEFAGK